jgi:hypothetical protein
VATDGQGSGSLTICLKEKKYEIRFVRQRSYSY